MRVPGRQLRRSRAPSRPLREGQNLSPRSQRTWFRRQESEEVSVRDEADAGLTRRDVKAVRRFVRPAANPAGPLCEKHLRRYLLRRKELAREKQDEE